jgi:hypothetical protein
MAHKRLIGQQILKRGVKVGSNKQKAIGEAILRRRSTKPNFRS